MTLETAKRIVQEHGELASKEALAVVRGGMTICEKKADGSRKYVWVKVKPTLTDDESSIDVALENQGKRKNIQLSIAPIGQALVEPVMPNTAKAVEIWHEIDSIVVE